MHVRSMIAFVGSAVVTMVLVSETGASGSCPSGPTLYKSSTALPCVSVYTTSGCNPSELFARTNCGFGASSQQWHAQSFNDSASAPMIMWCPVTNDNTMPLNVPLTSPRYVMISGYSNGCTTAPGGGGNDCGGNNNGWASACVSTCRNYNAGGSTNGMCDAANVAIGNPGGDYGCEVSLSPAGFAAGSAWANGVWDDNYYLEVVISSRACGATNDSVLRGYSVRSNN